MTPAALQSGLGSQFCLSSALVGLPNKTSFRRMETGVDVLGQSNSISSPGRRANGALCSLAREQEGKKTTSVLNLGSLLADGIRES